MKQLLLIAVVAVAVIAAGIITSPKAAAVDIFSQGCTGAASSSAACTDAKSSTNSSTDPIITIIGDVIKVVSYIVGVAAVVGIVLSGFRFITANGDSNAITNARRGLIYSLVGLLVAALAQTLVAFMLSKLT